MLHRAANNKGKQMAKHNKDISDGALIGVVDVFSKVLRSDTGMTEEAYSAMLNFFDYVGHKPAWLSKVEATDGMFYIPA